MIYTVTLNPSLDYTVWTDNMTAGVINRTHSEKIYPGGKGINVSVILKNLGFESTALGFCAGFTGDEINRMLTHFGCSTDFVRVARGFSRINIKVKSHNETELNGAGPQISEHELSEFMDKLGCISNGDVLVLAGSIPSSLPKDLYKKILASLSGKNIYTVLDAEGEALKSSLACRPFLIKPNLDELRGICNKDIETDEEIVLCAHSLQEMGARNVLVSLAGDGAVLITESGEIHRGVAHNGTLVNSVGAGDSMVGGFIAGFLGTRDYKKALDLGLAAGSATAFNEWLASKEDILKLHNLS